MSTNHLGWNFASAPPLSIEWGLKCWTSNGKMNGGRSLYLWLCFPGHGVCCYCYCLHYFFCSWPWAQSHVYWSLSLDCFFFPPAYPVRVAPQPSSATMFTGATVNARLHSCLSPSLLTPVCPLSDVSMCRSLRCLCVEQGILCQIMVVQLVTLRGQDRSSPHATMISDLLLRELIDIAAELVLALS